MSTPKAVTAAACGLPSIEYEMKYGVNPSRYHSRIAALQLQRAMREGGNLRGALEVARDSEANYHRVYPQGKDAHDRAHGRDRDPNWHPEGPPPRRRDA